MTCISCFWPKDPGLLARYGLEDKFVAGYIGTHGMAHALETLLRAAQQIRGMAGGERYRFIFLGDGAMKEQLVARAAEMALDNVIFIGSVPKQEVVRYWSLLDVSIIHLRKTKLFTTVIPSKLFESMGMGIPVLHGVAGESADIVNSEGVGLVFQPDDAVDLCEKLQRMQWDSALYQRLQARCLEAAKQYDRKVLAREMLGVIEGRG